MTPQQVQLVQASFAQLQPIASDAAALFYSNLFEASPELRPLFKGVMADQGERLMGMIGSAVGLLDRPDALLPVLRMLGARHLGYGVQQQHYALVGSALLKTLGQGLGDGFDADVHDAWETLYGVISQTMQQGAAASHAPLAMA
jgi:hemoglobin-like flavoprotein